MEASYRQSLGKVLLKSLIFGVIRGMEQACEILFVGSSEGTQGASTRGGA